MKNFVLLYTGGSGMPATEADQKAVLDEWMAWFGSLGESLVDGGTPFMGAKSISTDGKMHDGPFGSMATGYSVIKADSMDAAMSMAQRCPVLKSGAQISVYETMPAPGM